jgi:MFS family permease
MIALAVAMGIGRFVFTPLLPMMQRDLGISIIEGGWLASANYVGYLVGALSCMWIHVRSEWMIRIGLLLTAALTFAMGLSQDFTAWLVLRTLAGIASAWVLVFSSAWVLRQLDLARRVNLLSIVFSGPGVGILSTGLLVMFLTLQQSAAQSAWQLSGVTALLLTLLIWPALKPMHAAIAEASSPPMRSGMSWSRATIGLVACYGVAGFGYIIPATFLPLIAKQTIHDPTLLALFWPIFGLAVIAGLHRDDVSPHRSKQSQSTRRLFHLASHRQRRLAQFPDARLGLAGTVLVGSVLPLRSPNSPCAKPAI